MGTTVTINGVTMHFPNSPNISVVNNRVIIGGKDVTPDAKEINIKVEGNVQEIKVDSCNNLDITGNADSVNVDAGTVEIHGNVAGNVKVNAGNLKCRGEIRGGAKVDCGNISR